MNLSPKQLDEQASVHIDEWLDFDSERCKELDDNRPFTKKCMKVGFEAGMMVTDSLGRIWCKDSKTGQLHPFHFEYGKKRIGFKIATKASN